MTFSKIYYGSAYRSIKSITSGFNTFCYSHSNYRCVVNRQGSRYRIENASRYTQSRMNGLKEKVDSK